MNHESVGESATIVNLTTATEVHNDKQARVTPWVRETVNAIRIKGGARRTGSTPGEFTHSTIRERSDSSLSQTDSHTEDAASNGLADIKKQLTCLVCHEMLRDARVLPCLHSYCRRCIENMILDRQSKHAQCPSCDREITMDSYRCVKDLPRDAMAITLQDELSLCNGEVMLCDVCDESDAESRAVCRCRECALYLCGIHEEGHRRDKFTKHHALLSPEHLKSVSIKELHRPLFCSVHPSERLVLFCHTCDTNVCRNCALTDPHKGHQCQFVEEAFNKVHPRLSDQLSDAKQLCANVEDSIPAIDSMLTRVKLASSKAIHDIDDSIDAQIRSLEERREQLRATVETVRVIRTTALGLQRERMKRARDRLRDAFCTVRTVLEEGSPAYVLSMKDVMSERLNALMSEKYELYPREDYQLVYTANGEDIRRVIECYGGIDSCYASHVTSTAEGDGLHGARLGEEARFEVITRDQEGRPITCSNEDLNIIITDHSDNCIEVTLSEKQTGKYIVSYTPPMVGQYQIAINIRSFPISGSPFVISTPYEEPRDYTKVQIPLLSFGAAGSERGQFNGARGLAVDTRNRIIVCDRDNARVQVFDPSGKPLFKFGRKGDALGEFQCGPSDVVVDSNDRIIVSDWSGGSALVFDAKGVFLHEVKPDGNHFGQFCHLAVDQCDNVLVSDYPSRAIYGFNSDGAQILKYNLRNTDEGDELLNAPSAIAVNSKGEIIVALANGGGFKVLDSNGNITHRFTVSESSSGNIFTPESLATDKYDNILAIDSYNSFILVLDHTGTVKAKCASDELASPYGIAVDNMGRVVVSDSSQYVKIF